MKKITFLISTLAISMISLVSCVDDKNDVNDTNSVFSDELLNMFPDAKNVKWSTKGNYDVAEFSSKCETKIAWFSNNIDNGSKWQMTETEVALTALPLAIRTTFGQTEYSKAPWVADNEVDKLERVGMSEVYVIDVEKQNPETEVELFFSSDGKLIKTEVDADSDNDNSDELPIATLPAEITATMEAKYPGAYIMDIDHENGIIELDILYNGVAKEVQFNAANEWVMTVTEITLDWDIPAAVTVTLNSLLTGKYADYERSYGADFIETPTNTYYLFELEHKTSDNDFDLKIDVEGIQIP